MTLKTDEIKIDVISAIHHPVFIYEEYFFLFIFVTGRFKKETIKNIYFGQKGISFTNF